MTALDVRRVDHVSYTVGDIDRSVDFYVRFGFERVNRYAAAGPELDIAVATENADMEIQLLRRADGDDAGADQLHPPAVGSRGAQLGGGGSAYGVRGRRHPVGL